MKMPRKINAKLVATAALATGLAALATGCGTTRSTDTVRTATEQLLISDAIDRAVQSIHFETLRGQSVFLDDGRLGEVVDRNYLISSLRQRLLASGCSLKEKREDADFVVEARAGAIGTDRNDLLFGIPSMNVPQIFPVQPMAAAIPEIPFAKRRDQQGIAKIAVFAYHRESGVPVWQSGLMHEESSANDVWILGAGPFQRGTIYDGTEFAGKTLRNQTFEGPGATGTRPAINLARERVFTSPAELTRKPERLPTTDQAVSPAGHLETAATTPGIPPQTTTPQAEPTETSPPAALKPPVNAAPITPEPPLPQPRF
jgi:hypothetical protein